MTEVVESLAVGMLGCNCTILTASSTQDAVVVDPGDEAPRILEILKAHGLHLRAILHTHAHFDHLQATGALARETGAPVYLHRGDLPLWENIGMQTALFGFPTPELPAPDHFLEDGQRLAVGAGQELAVLHTPGHTPGSVCFHAESAALLLSGDTLFRMGIGRTDLWGGSYPQIMESIKERILSLPGDTRVIPGHGPQTTIAEEASGNPFLATS